MMLYLQDLAKQREQTTNLIITERLPAFLLAPCSLTVRYHVEAKDNFYLIHMHTTGLINVVCQRCLNAFVNSFDNQTEIAVCQSYEQTKLLLQYECIVSNNWQVVLEDLITDELHLYVDQFHFDKNDCDSEIIKILN